MLIALDRMERGHGDEVGGAGIRDRRYGIPVVAIATLDDVMTFIEASTDLARYAPEITEYRARYGTQ